MRQSKPRCRLSLTRAALATLIMGLAEYVHLVEEGSLREARQEAELEDDSPSLDAGAASRLKVRLEDELSRLS
jgi:hypothetical protein